MSRFPKAQAAEPISSPVISFGVLSTVIKLRLSWEHYKPQDGHNPQAATLRANIAETLLVHSITEQGGKEIQHEEYEDILSGPVGRAQ